MAFNRISGMTTLDILLSPSGKNQVNSYGISGAWGFPILFLSSSINFRMADLPPTPKMNLNT